MIRFFVSLQSFLTHGMQCLVSLARIIILSRPASKLPDIEEDKEIVILSNGPSLTRTIEKHRSFLEGKYSICVNFFPTTDMFQDLKPDFAIISAPELWWEEMPETFRVNSNTLFTALSEKTTWPLVFFIPCDARKYRTWQDILAKNNNITVCFYNNTPVEGWKWFRHMMFDLNAGMPRPQNIMIPSIHLSLQMRFKKVYLWGADHSWLKDLSVDDDNNALMNHKHFYDEGSTKPQTMHKAGYGKRKLHEILYKLMKSFESYFTLKDYADALNATVINNTPDSFIDAFEKQRLD